MRHYVDVVIGNVLAPTGAEAALRGDVPRMFEAGKSSDYCLWKESHPRPFYNSSARPISASSDPRRPPSSASPRPSTGGWGCRFAGTDGMRASPCASYTTFR